MFSGADHRGTAGVDLDDEYVAITDWGWQLLEERASLVTDGVDHPQHGARAGRPLVKVAEGSACLAEGELGAEARDRHHQARR